MVTAGNIYNSLNYITLGLSAIIFCTCILNNIIKNGELLPLSFLSSRLQKVIKRQLFPSSYHLKNDCQII
ncbi:hypothetical protein IQ31_02265 [Sphingobacterium siyangense]|uniref:Uncharacterized protein n=1 Tax=Sphingobacterium siyangense TaxID=459529 RepID=A0A562MKB8_9SPHI|nr:hypothetical protein IQ31_02265 [Sphingobacterium siyangense]